MTTNPTPSANRRATPTRRWARCTPRPPATTCGCTSRATPSSGPTDGGLGHSVPIITRGEGHKIWDDRGNEYIDGLAGLFVVQVGHGREELAEAAAKQAKRAGLLPALVLRPPPGHRAGRAPGGLRARRPQPRLLHDRRRRGRRDRVEAGQAVLQADRQADQAQGHQPRRRLPRHPAGRPVDHRHPGGQGDVRAAGARRASRCRTPTSTARPSTCATTRRPSAAGPPTGSPRPSSSRAPTPSPRSSSSRCRTPAAASRRRPATSSGSARSATSTTCCSSPTRSSARSAASARCSPATTSATCPTSSPAPRA